MGVGSTSSGDGMGLVRERGCGVVWCSVSQCSPVGWGCSKFMEVSDPLEFGGGELAVFCPVPKISIALANHLEFDASKDPFSPRGKLLLGAPGCSWRQAEKQVQRFHLDGMEMVWYWDLFVMELAGPWVQGAEQERLVGVVEGEGVGGKLCRHRTVRVRDGYQERGGV